MKKAEMYAQLVKAANAATGKQKETLLKLAEAAKPKTKPSGPVKRVFVSAPSGWQHPEDGTKWQPQLIALQKQIARLTAEKPIMRTTLLKQINEDKQVHAALNTVQDPSRIYAFYQKKLLDAGGLVHTPKVIS